jgi:[protein-PII] uridylyltransferase
VFDLQNAVAESFGYRRNPAGPAHRRPAGARQRALMKRYYWAAKAVTQLNQILLLNIEERLNPSTHEPRPINERFNDKAGMIDVASDDLYQRKPHAILETFLLYQTTVGIKGLSARTLRALYNARDVMDAVPQRPGQPPHLFMRHPAGARGHHPRHAADEPDLGAGALPVGVPRIVGQMQHDLFHVYTVDQHILMVLRNVRRFFIVEHAHEYPFCSQLAAGWDKPWMLYVAALFHDIAKGRGGDHSELGAREVRRFLPPARHRAR